MIFLAVFVNDFGTQFCFAKKQKKKHLARKPSFELCSARYIPGIQEPLEVWLGDQVYLVQLE